MTMPWVKLDDHFIDHPKFLRVGPLAGYLHIAAIAWSNQNLRDGVIPHAQPARLAAWHLVNDDLDPKVVGQIPDAQVAVEWAALVDRLIQFGLWHERDDGDYEIHDYHEYQPSRAQVLADRKRLGITRADAGRKGGGSKPEANRKQKGGQTQGQNGSPVAVAVAVPVPLERTTSSLVGDHGLDDPATVEPEVLRLSQLLASLIVQRDPKATPAADSKRWLQAMRLLVADRGGDLDEVERVLRWSQADPFWQANILSPSKLREQFTQLALKARAGPASAGDNDEMRQLEAAFPDAPTTKVRAAAGQLRYRGIPVTEEALRDFGQQHPVWALDEAGG